LCAGKNAVKLSRYDTPSIFVWRVMRRFGA
jgi:hypothetical protein